MKPQPLNRILTPRVGALPNRKVCGGGALACILLGLMGCGRPSGSTPTSSANSAAPAASALSREDQVELADRLASRASHAQGSDARELHVRAAELRESAYRIQHRSVDALEAVEQLRAVERDPDAPCQSRLRRILLEAEQSAKPAGAYTEIYALKLDPRTANCRSEIEQALQALAAFRPPVETLQAIEREHAPRRELGTGSQSSRVLPPQPAVDAANSAPVVITKVERYGAADAARVVVFVSRPSRFEVGEVTTPSGARRVFVDVDSATFSTQSSYELSGLVEHVRLGARASATRVALDLSAAASHRVFYLPEPYRLVIDVLKADVSQSGLPAKIRRAVLDPGHGGHDPGAIGPSGLREKDVALDIAHRAAPLLARELGISTLLTRDGDQFVPLDERTARANAFRADLFISIHCNASEDPGARGAMVFVLDRSPTSLSHHIAARENATSSEASVELANSLSKLTDPASLSASTRLAELLGRAAQASFSEKYADVPALPVQRAGFYVLAGAHMPAVLFETSFISNAAGEAHLATPDFRQKLADSIVNAVRAYRAGL
ncbi:MAG TPA: N-acetylmuramoyl-L-alanine amidase [Polyangiaceae bacterium]|nr:N-acetylmuramoyl-L-alanine amidase [Polyangiaceae bacterium]